MKQQPTAVDAQAKHVVVTWSDDAEHRIDNTVLRAACPCASCNDVRDAGEKITVLEGLRAQRLWLVGGYALGVEWSDGHSDGMFAFTTLRELGVTCEAHRALDSEPR